MGKKLSLGIRLAIYTAVMGLYIGVLAGVITGVRFAGNIRSAMYTITESGAKTLEVGLKSEHELMAEKVGFCENGEGLDEWWKDAVSSDYDFYL